MRIALFDYLTIPNNPTGSCNLALLSGLCEEHEFTIFSAAFQNPRPDRIRWVPVPVLRRPLAALFISFHVTAVLCFIWDRLRRGQCFDLIQIAESNLLIGDVSYAHFCHRAFLNEHWRAVQPGGLRGALRWFDHWLHAVLERGVHRTKDCIVVPSRGLRDELVRYYPELEHKVRVISNPVDIKKMTAPSAATREILREKLSLRSEDVVLVFCALGHFERKGLGILLDALEQLNSFPWRLLVVGGNNLCLAPYRRRGGGRVLFVGAQPDVRQFFWAADGFVLPSAYETFSLVSFEAAAAGLPLLVSKLYGVEEILQDGENGFQLSLEPTALRETLDRFFHCPAKEREKMGERARRSLSSYLPAEFVENWRRVYRDLELLVYSRRQISAAGTAA